MKIDYERFARVITRSIEVGNEPNADPVVATIFKQTLSDAAADYLALDAGVSTAMTSFGKENREALDALVSLDGPYRVARAAVLAMLPNTDLPDTLKSQPTDTDQLNAIARLLDLIDDHVGEQWADVLLAGEFGTKAAKTVQELSESIAANKALSKARSDRAAAYGPTYEKYLRFKQVVRNAYGPGSKQYRRIHLRSSPGAADPGATEP
jgi:3-oxoacyl-ACP reductase-like protein